MPRFSLIEHAIWNDPDFLKLSTEARLLFIWAWTNPGAAICGLYHASIKQMEKALGQQIAMDQEDAYIRVVTALGHLERKPIVKYDGDAEVLWVVNRARYANRSPKVARAMQKEVERCPSSPLVGEFVARYGQMLNLRLEGA